MSEEAHEANAETSIAVTRKRMLVVPDLSLIALIGSSGSGKSTFAARHFKPTEILSSDAYRAIVGDDPNDQKVTGEAFGALHHIANVRLKLGRLTAVDATSVKAQDRAPLIALARQNNVPAVAIVLNLDERICRERNASRPDRQFGPHVVRNHVRMLRQGLRGLEREGFRHVYILNSPKEIEAVLITRIPLPTDKRQEAGPFDVIGDVHGCYDELAELLTLLGYQPDAEAGMRHPERRRAVFVGDLVDRGPKVVETVDLVWQMIAAGQAFCLPGNHDDKLLRYLKGRNVQISYGLAESIAQIEALPEEARSAWKKAYLGFVDALPSHIVLDEGRLVVAHAGMKEEYQGRASRRVREFAMYGETTGETDEYGLPIRANWAVDYRGSATVVYGHTAVPEPVWLNDTVDIDTGCVFGGKLTALRWPERELVNVAAHRVYHEPERPLVAEAAAGEAATDETGTDTLLRIEDVLGKQHIVTRLVSTVTVEADRAATALEVMSRFALDPRWLIYLPPTMSPSETSHQPGWLEHPVEAFAYYRQQDVERVVCEEKHMGSRAVLVLCRDGQAAHRRFGVPEDGTPGACYTRTGRRFFDDDALDRELVTRLADALGRTGFWERFATDWVCLDAEILPWNAKARGLLRDQYAPVAAAGTAALAAAAEATEQAAARGVAVGELLGRLHGRQEQIARYAEAYRAYCWEVAGLEGMRVAPFHLLATEGHTYFDRDHLWHMAELSALAEAEPLFLATAHHAVDVNDEASCAEGIAWWLELTERHGEGMVVKPLQFVVRGPRGLAQPAVKCRGREYLRIIYGPDYTEPENLERLRKRGLATKRNLAAREFGLGVEALERLTRGEPLWKVHQAVFGVLALESEPVDPRL